MTKFPRSLIVLVPVLALALAGCTQAVSPTAPAISDQPDGCAGISVIVDATALDSPAVTTGCVVTDQPGAAADVLTEVGVSVEGTTEYGDQVICRVNGLPLADFALTDASGIDYFESCESMPAMHAYWAMWQKDQGGKWDYAQEGLGSLVLEPGSEIGLVFTLNGQPEQPDF